MNQDIQEKAREEAIAILGDELKDVCPTAEQTKQMTYINQIMKETLRINDPAPRVFPRVVTEDTVLSSGTFIPKGSLITVNIFNIHHSDKVWSNPEQFDPDRFAEDGEGVRESGEGMAYLPFGNGARQCLGMNFSLNEQRVMLSMICKSPFFHSFYAIILLTFSFF
jgi:cytochrome P450